MVTQQWSGILLQERGSYRLRSSLKRGISCHSEPTAWNGGPSVSDSPSWWYQVVGDERGQHCPCRQAGRHVDTTCSHLATGRWSRAVRSREALRGGSH